MRNEGVGPAIVFAGIIVAVAVIVTGSGPVVVDEVLVERAAAVIGFVLPMVAGFLLVTVGGRLVWWVAARVVARRAARSAGRVTS